jgi:Gamma-glutamyl cyclotransferase, AIG2-like
MSLFAYGMLMTAEGLRPVLGDRVGSFRFRPARLPGWRRIWNAYSEDWNGGVLNVEPHPDASVVGVLVEGVDESDLARLDPLEATHLPRETVYVEPFGGEPVPAQVYWRRRGNHNGKASARYRALVLERAREAGPEVWNNLRTGSVDPSGQPLLLA